MRDALAALMRQAVGAVARTGLEEFPGVWNARLAALDVLLQAPALQLVMARALSAVFPRGVVQCVRGNNADTLLGPCSQGTTPGADILVEDPKTGCN